MCCELYEEELTKTLCLRGMEGVPQCCKVFDCLRSSEIEEFAFYLKRRTSLPVSVMTIYRILYLYLNHLIFEN